ncbi:hypothetical protein Tco_0795049 [Tanacetum coccineum]
MSDLIGGLVFLGTKINSLKRYSGGGVVDLIGDEDSTDEDGDIGVSVSLGGEIFSKGKESLESNIGDSDNTRDCNTPILGNLIDGKSISNEMRLYDSTMNFFEKNDLKAQLQDKDSTICKLKDIIKSMREKTKEENVNYDYSEIVTKNVELENKNEDLKAQIQDKEQADILQGLVEQAKAKQPLDKELDFAYKHAQRIQELLVYVQDTCPNAIKLSAKKVAITPKNNVKKVKFAEPLTSLSNIKHVESLKTTSRNIKNKVEAQPRKVNKKNLVVEPICDDNVKHSKLIANFDLNCATCKKSWFDDVHDKCLLDFMNNVNSRAKSAKKHKKENIWRPTSHEFTKVGLKWKPTGRTFTIVDSSKKAKIVESKNANHSKPNHTWGSNPIDIPSSSSHCARPVRFGNDHIARIMGYGDYQLGNVTISRGQLSWRTLLLWRTVEYNMVECKFNSEWVTLLYTRNWENHRSDQWYRELCPPMEKSGGGVVDLTGDEDPTNEDGDIGVSVSLGVEIFLEGKKSQESNIGDSDNTGDWTIIMENIIIMENSIIMENIIIIENDILGVTIQRAIKEILGDTTQRDIEEILGDTTQRDIEEILGDTTQRDIEEILGDTTQRDIEEILGDTTQRDIEEILGDTTQRDIRRCYPKRYFHVFRQ